MDEAVMAELLKMPSFNFYSSYTFVTTYLYGLLNILHHNQVIWLYVSLPNDPAVLVQCFWMPFYVFVGSMISRSVSSKVFLIDIVQGKDF